MVSKCPRGFVDEAERTLRSSVMMFGVTSLWVPRVSVTGPSTSKSGSVVGLKLGG